MATTLAEKIDEDLKTALKGRDALRVSTLRFLKASLLNCSIAKKVERLEDGDVLDVIVQLIKQHQDSIDSFSKGKREDLVAKETKELEILKSYCPHEASREELLQWIQEAVGESGAVGLQDLGKVMKLLMPKTKGRADGKVVHELVRQALEGGLHGREA
ncbi:MAG: GatB/YqeY domain-containing protein [Candidatus Omnitrophica bacterium]|nr:GatB/YqeY domain-containing protein [Candidatus Omnitrophota bacterium]